MSRRMRTVVAFLLGFGVVFVAGAEGARVDGIKAIRASLEGSVRSEGLGVFWREAGVEDPEALVWREDVDEPRVETWVRFRDVGRDGLPDVLLGLHDGAFVHWVLLRARGVRSWGDPVYLSYTALPGRDLSREHVLARLEHACPRSMVCSGRVLLFHSQHTTGQSWMTPDRHEIFELTETGVRTLLVRETGGKYENRVEEWVMATETPGELVLFRWSENFRNGSRTLYVRRVEPGAHEPGPVEEVEFDRVEALRPMNAPGTDRPAIDDPMHPAIVAFEIGRDRREALGSGVWERLGIEPGGFRLFDLKHETEYPIRTAVSYKDIDDDGDPEAWIVMEYLASHYWMLMDRDADDAWEAIGMKGSLWIEHGTRYFDDKPPTPTAHHVAGRTLLVYQTGSTHDLGSEIRSEVYLYEDGALTELWSEVTFGHQHDSQSLAFEPDTRGGVLLTVTTYKGWSSDEANVRTRRSWVLPAGGVALRAVGE